MIRSILLLRTIITKSALFPAGIRYINRARVIIRCSTSKAYAITSSEAREEDKELVVEQDRGTRLLLGKVVNSLKEQKAAKKKKRLEPELEIAVETGLPSSEALKHRRRAQVTKGGQDIETEAEATITLEKAVKKIKRSRAKKVKEEAGIEIPLGSEKTVKRTKRSRAKKAKEETGIEIPLGSEKTVERTKRSRAKKAKEETGVEISLGSEKTVERIKRSRAKKAKEEAGVEISLGSEKTIKRTNRSRVKREKQEEAEAGIQAAIKSRETVKAPKKLRVKKKKQDEVHVATALSPAQASNPIILRDYQKECIDAILENVKQGYKRLAVSLATGSGKTVIFTQLIDKHPPLNDTATQTLILVHRRELLEQALRHCTRAYPEKTVDVEMANKHATGLADITLASIASISRKDRLEKFDPHRFKLILIDECHHAVSRTYMDVLDYFGALNPQDSGGDHPVIVGVSATLSRHDGLKLGTVLDRIVYHKDYLTMIEENWLSNVCFTTVQTNVDLSAVRQTRGDFDLAELSQAVNTTQANDITVKAWLEKAGGKRRSTLVFCVDIAHVTGMTDTFRRHGIDAKFITSLTPKEERSKRLDEFRQSRYPVLVNCGIFTEGTDIPSIDCVLLARPTRSKNLLIQMIGRGMRLSPGKDSCHVIDMIGVLGRGIMTTPTLFGLDPFQIIEQMTPEMMRSMSETEEEELIEKHRTLDIGVEDLGLGSQSMPIKDISFTDYDTVWDLLNDTRQERQIRQISPNAWVKIGPHDYVLSALDMVLLIERQENGTYTVSSKKQPKYSIFAKQFMTPKTTIVTEGIDVLENVVTGADTYASHHFPRAMILHSSLWRKEPASQAQMTQLEKMQPEKSWDQRKLTKGQANDMLTRIKYGYSRFKKAWKQVQKKLVSEEKLKTKGEVKVGPLL